MIINPKSKIKPMNRRKVFIAASQTVKQAMAGELGIACEHRGVFVKLIERHRCGGRGKWQEVYRCDKHNCDCTIRATEKMGTVQAERLCNGCDDGPRPA